MVVVLVNLLNAFGGGCTVYQVKTSGGVCICLPTDLTDITSGLVMIVLITY